MPQAGASLYYVGAQDSKCIAGEVHAQAHAEHTQGHTH